MFADLLTALVVVFLVMTVLFVAAMILGGRALVRSNRVSPKQRTPAPLVWLASPRGGARLHRRLRGAAATARAATSALPGAMDVSDLARRLEHDAVVLDHHLVAASRVGPASARRQSLAPIERDVRRVEVAAARVAAIARTPRPFPGFPGRQGDVVEEVTDRLDALEAAIAEVAAIERNADGGALPLPSRPATGDLASAEVRSQPR